MHALGVRARRRTRSISTHGSPHQLLRPRLRPPGRRNVEPRAPLKRSRGARTLALVGKRVGLDREEEHEARAHHPFLRCRRRGHRLGVLTPAISPRPVTKRRLYTHPGTLTLAVTLACGSWVWPYPSALHSPSTHVKTTSLSHSSAVGLWKKKVARLTWSPPGRDGVGVRGRGRPRSPDSPGRHLVG